MKVLVAICVIFSIGSANCGLISSPAEIRTTSYGSYSAVGPWASAGPVLQRAVPYVQHVAQPVVSYQSPLTYAYPQQIYQHSVVPQPLYAPSVVNTPLYSGVYGGSPFLAQAPASTGSYNPGLPFQGSYNPGLPFQGSYNPGLPFQIFGSYPAQGQAPVQGQAPEQSQPPIESADSPAPSVPQNDSSAPGTTVDNDTVSVESA